jgi:CPA2 family monovalent cation:H+ antiporter-2
MVPPEETFSEAGPFAAAYVFMLAIIGPLVARGAEPLVRRLGRT